MYWATSYGRPMHGSTTIYHLCLHAMFRLDRFTMPTLRSKNPKFDHYFQLQHSVVAPPGRVATKLNVLNFAVISQEGGSGNHHQSSNFGQICDFPQKGWQYILITVKYGVVGAFCHVKFGPDRWRGMVTGAPESSKTGQNCSISAVLCLAGATIYTDQAVSNFIDYYCISVAKLTRHYRWCMTD